MDADEHKRLSEQLTASATGMLRRAKVEREMWAAKVLLECGFERILINETSVPLSSIAKSGLRA